MSSTKQHTSKAAGWAAVLAAASANAMNVVRRMGGKAPKVRRWTEPHQGKKECARRRAQMASGMLPPGEPAGRYQ